MKKLLLYLLLLPALVFGQIDKKKAFFLLNEGGSAPYATNTVLALYYSTVETTSYSGIIDQSISTIKMASTGVNFNSASSNFDNQAVFLGTKTGNPTAGSGTLDVYVTYRIITL